MRGADKHADEVRHDQPDEGDDAVECDGARNQQCYQCHRDHAQTLDVDTDMPGRPLPQ